MIFQFSDVTLASLAIPDTHCSPEDDLTCPSHFKCKSLSLSIQERGYGVFDNICKLHQQLSCVDCCSFYYKIV